MKRNHPFRLSDLAINVVNSDLEDENEKYDLLVYPIGYERRSRYVAERTVGRWQKALGYVFPDGHVLSFEQNLRVSKDWGVSEIHGVDKLELLESIVRALDCKDYSSKRILVDISSFNRRLIASLSEILLTEPIFDGCDVTFAYSLAKFREPPKRAAPFMDFAPIVGLEGWTAHPERPTVLVVGVGYAEDEAIGAVEYLDPSVTFGFLPTGVDFRFRLEVERNNLALLALINRRNVVDYKIMFPYQTFWELLTLVQHLSATTRVVLVPMGPKIFCSLCILVKMIVGDEIALWRASGHELSSVSDVEADGAMCGYTVWKQNRADSSRPGI